MKHPDHPQIAIQAGELEQVYLEEVRLILSSRHRKHLTSFMVLNGTVIQISEDQGTAFARKL